ncbi:hypothetical protein [Patulibacter sp.]|uniref:hypothetical protein n=1 Tax=Patulibacter sp. TaxID=1912859 RepID=UPI0027209337|nr:hypothetical protein [Patulibacter sp.]MDO9408935.1 hypothetical protein [Patulibacter sp.]
MRVPRSSVVLLTAAAAALGASSTAGAVAWDTTDRGPGTALDVPFVGSVNDPRVAIASDETAVAAWYTSDEAPSVRVATRAPGAAWSTTAVDLTASAPLPELGAFYGVDDVQVATGRNGVVVVSWFEDHEGGMIVRTAVRRGAGPWVVSSPSGPVGADLDDPFVAVSDDGEIAAAWIDERDDDAQLRIRTLAPGTDTWTRPTDVVVNRDNEPRLGYLPTGELVGTYQDRDTDAVVVFEKACDAAPVLRRDLALGGDSESAEPDLAVSRDGRVAVVWQEEEDGEPVLVRSAVRSASGAWSTSMLDRAGTSNDLPEVAASDTGFVAAWDSRDEGGPAVDAAVLGPGATWEPTERVVGQLAGPGESDVAVAPDGTATVVWEIFEDRTPMVAGSTRPADGVWAEPERVAVTDEGELSGPQVAAYADGSFTGVWRDAPDTAGDQTELVRSGLLDITGPVVRTDPPATTTIGVPLTLSAVAEDRWNAVGSVGWTLPGGVEVAGRDVTWTPTALGDATLTIRARDARGNETVRTVVVRVVPVAVAPPAGETPPATPVPPTVVAPPTPPAAPAPPAAATPPSACAVPFVELIGIRATGTARAPRVRLTGVAGRSLVGRTVEVRRDGRKVGTARVAADRSVEVSVPAPRPAGARARARYRLVVGDARSRALKATRSATISRAVRLSGGRVAVTGRISSLRRSTTLTITGTPACGGARATRTTVRSDARGRFRVTLPAPAVPGSATIYRIAPRGSGTATLPIVVAAG